MRTFFALFFVIFQTLHLYGQKQWIVQLPCDTWGTTTQFVPFEEASAKSSTFQYKPVGMTADNYKTFDLGWPISFLTPRNQSNTNPDPYVNNIQIIRWNLKDHSTKYNLIVKNIFDEILYNEPLKSCAVLLFPDSIE